MLLPNLQKTSFCSELPKKQLEMRAKNSRVIFNGTQVETKRCDRKEWTNVQDGTIRDWLFGLKGYWSVGEILCVKDFIEKIIPYISLNS